MKRATYTDIDGSQFTVEYDPNGLCRICGHPVHEASVGGTDVCPWCDAGNKRPQNMLGNNIATFFYRKTGASKAFHDLTDDSPYCKLEIGSKIDMELPNGDSYEGVIVKKESSKEFVGWLHHHEIE